MNEKVLYKSSILAISMGLLTLVGLDNIPSPIQNNKSTISLPTQKACKKSTTTKICNSSTKIRYSCSTSQKNSSS